MGGEQRTYRNTRTGICIQTPCECAGADWEEIRHAPAPPGKQSDGRIPTAKKSTTRKAR